MGTSSSKAQGPPGAIQKRTGYLPGVTGADKSGLSACEGNLQKQSSKGLWANRYFKLNNQFLAYYEGGSNTPAAAINLSMVSEVVCTDVIHGEFHLEFEDGTLYRLRAATREVTNTWIDALEDRIAWAQENKPAGGARGGEGRGGKVNNKNIKKGRGRVRRDETESKDENDDDEEEEERPRKPAPRGRPSKKAVSTDEEDAPSAGDDDADADSDAPKGRRTNAKPAASPVKPSAHTKPAAKPTRKPSSHDDDTDESADSDTAARAAKTRGTAKPSVFQKTPSVSAASDDSDAPVSRTRSSKSSPAAGKPRRPVAKAAASDSDDEDVPRRGKAASGAGAKPATKAAPKQPAKPVSPAPTFKSVVYQRASTRLGKWQKWFMALSDNHLYLSQDSDPIESPVSILRVSDIVTLKAGYRGDKQAIFIASATADQEYLLRADDISTVETWEARIKLAKAHEEKYAKARQARQASKAQIRAKDSDEEEEDADSDADADDGFRLPPAPKWFQQYDKYTKDKDREAKWMETSMQWFDSLFSDIYQKDGDNAEDAVETNMTHAKVVITKLADATTRACGIFAERVRECKSRTRPDIIKHFVQMFDLKFLQELNPLTTGSTPGSLSPLQLLQLIDCIEGFLKVRTTAVGSLSLTAQENRPGNVLRETRRDMISKYIKVMAPKLADITDKVLKNLFNKQADLVKRKMGTRIATDCPQDLFSLMSEHLKLAKNGGSLTLQRKLLSLLMAEIAGYGGQVLWFMTDMWTRTPSAVDLDFVTATINDSATMLDLLEQLEAEFAPALQLVTQAADNELARMNSRIDASPADEKDEFDKEEEEEAQQDLDAVEQDIPRAREELLKCGTQLSGILVDIINDDLRGPLADLFGTKWDQQNLVESMFHNIESYLTELGLLLEPYFYDKLAGWTLASFAAQYLVRLINPEQVSKVFCVKYSAGFTSKFKLTEQRMGKVVADTLCIQTSFVRFMPREEVDLVTKSLTFAREMLTGPPDILLLTFEAALRMTPNVSVEVYLMFEKCIQLREDLDKPTRKSLLEEAKKTLFMYGQPPDEADELLALVEGSGVLSGLAISQGKMWSPQQATETIYRILFPQNVALAKSKDLFKGWVPPETPVVAEAAPVAFNMSDFTGGGGGGMTFKPYVPDEDESAATKKKEAARTAPKKPVAREEEEESKPSIFTSNTGAKNARRRGKRDDDDSD